ncbi:PLVAP protein, partial [Trogon melanurus]|nr:PLVAP protein [Trogon melanurus]
MEKSNYAMAKFGLEAKEAMPKRECGFYVKYIFLFTSLIQFLIILGLVLFMVYGNAQAGTEKHLRQQDADLQDRYKKIITLSGRNMNLTRTLNATLKEKQKLQDQVLKVQRDLDKCNSTQGSNLIPELQVMPKIIFYQKTKLDECYMTNSLINANCSADKALLRSKLDQTALTKKELEENCRQVGATLSRAVQEKQSCQRELLTTKTVYEATKTNMELARHECNTLRSDMSSTMQHIRTRSPYSCDGTQEDLNQLSQRIEGLFRWQQDRETKYVGKSVCDMYLLQCRLNCSDEKQELEKKLQSAEKQVKGGQEEKKKLLAEKEQLSKELEEKSKAAAAQAGHLKEQLAICMGSKV